MRKFRIQSFGFFSALNFHFFWGFALLHFSQARPFNSRAVEFSQYKLRTHFVCCIISTTNIEARSYCKEAMSTNEPVVSVEWLHANLRQPDIKVLSSVDVCSKNALHYFFPGLVCSRCIIVLIGLASSMCDVNFDDHWLGRYLHMC